MTCDPGRMTEFEVAPARLLQTALGRIRRQTQYRRPLERGGRAAAGIDALLAQAADCVAALARPRAVFVPVRADWTAAGDLRLSDLFTLTAGDIGLPPARGGSVTAYLLTLGFSQADAFARLNGDYAAQHVQTDLSSEVLFALGREAFGVQQAQARGRLRRVSIRTSDICGASRLWDAGRVQALIGQFGAANPGVSVTSAGCFQPLHSLIGLTIEAPPEG